MRHCGYQTIRLYQQLSEDEKGDSLVLGGERISFVTGAGLCQYYRTAGGLGIRISLASETANGITFSLGCDCIMSWSTTICQEAMGRWRKLRE